MQTIEDCRKFWADVAKEHGWYKEPFYVQVWRDKSGKITDSVAYAGMTADIDITLERPHDEQIEAKTKA